MGKRLDNEKLYAYVLRLQDGVTYESYVDNLPEDRRVQQQPFKGKNRRKVIDIRYLLGRVMPTGHDWSLDPEGGDIA